LKARVDENGNILLLADQDRSQWDQALIARGLEYITKSASGDEISSYHIEAAIAAVHSTSATPEETDWQQIVELYDKLYRKNGSPVTALNRAIAIAELNGAEAGLHAINSIPNLELLKEYYLLPATLGELHFRLRNCELAARYFFEALSLTNSSREKKLLEQKIAKL
jgi:RNA polymerase sigma-70 factor (ECF subfamily)